jgi:hypothetical protein
MAFRNIYIRSLEIGFESEKDGMSFDKLKSTLTKEGYSYSDTILRAWYYSNFAHGDRHLFLAGYSEIPDGYDSVPLPLSSDSIMKYIKYVELRENRESTKKAIKHSKLAIWVATASMIINVISLVLVYEGNQRLLQTTKIDREMESSIKANQPCHHKDSLFETGKIKKQEIDQDTLQNKAKVQIGQ